MCGYNHWVYTEGKSSYGVFQVIGLEETAAQGNETQDGIEIKWIFTGSGQNESSANVKILNMAGELIRTIVTNIENCIVTWDLRNSSGNKCSTGVYIAVIEASGKRVLGREKLRAVSTL